MTVVRTIKIVIFLIEILTIRKINSLVFAMMHTIVSKTTCQNQKAQKVPNLMPTLFSKYILSFTVKMFTIFCETKSVPLLWPSGFNICLEVTYWTPRVASKNLFESSVSQGHLNHPNHTSNLGTALVVVTQRTIFDTLM